MRKPHLVSFVLGAVLVAGTAVPTAAFAEASTPSRAVTTVSAGALLRDLPVKSESHGSSYARSKFRSWVDADHDGEDTRTEVLKAESSQRVTESRHHTVKTGRWTSRYDGKTYTVPSKLTIDHLVPLKEAWTSGAYMWSAAKRQAYANDLGYAATLMAVSVHAARVKGDQEPNAYLPPKKSYRCTYVRNWIAVKARWNLSVDKAEKQHLTADLKRYCTSTSVAKPGPTSDVVLPAPAVAASVSGTPATNGTFTVTWPSYSCPAGSGGPLAGWEVAVSGDAAHPGSIPLDASPRSIAVTAASAPGKITIRYAAYCGSRRSPFAPSTSVPVRQVAPSPNPTPVATAIPAPVTSAPPSPSPTPTATASPTPAPTALVYANCAAADAAHASPIFSWQSGYSRDLDGDGDGIACEAGDPYSTNPGYTPPTDPVGATAICRDGTYSYSAQRSGTCSGHGGVSRWL